MNSVNISAKRLKTARLWWAVALIILLAGGFVWTRQQEQAAGGKKGMRDMKNIPVPVTLAPVTLQTVPLQIQTIGTVEPISTVTIKPQIEGRLTGIHFQEGAFVEQGQLLFSIDTQPIQASLAQAQAVVSKDQSLVAQAQANLVRDQSAVKQAQANIDRDLAQLEYARAQEKRFATLLKDDFISQDQYEQAVTSRRAAEATVVSDRSALENAQAIVAADRSSIESAQANVRADQAVVESNRIKLAYGTIRAPFSGRTGSLKIHVGDTVKLGDTELVQLDRLNPINVSFSVPEQSLKSLRALGKARRFPVTAETRETPPTLLTGLVDFLDNSVDTNTGTIRMKARFANETRKLWPGQFVDVVLKLAEQANAVVIPLPALQSGQQGDYVFVAQAGFAKMRPVVVDRIVGNQVVIRTGLTAGEQVVTDGQFQLSEGSKLQVKSGSSVTKSLAGQ